MKIFISYRRADSREVVDRMKERLVMVYGHEAIFRDIDSIPLGMNFKEVLDEATATCDVMLVIIGPQWASITFPNSDKKRLDDPGDFTRIEVETGLAYENILVIPVLVKNADMPSSNDIPESLQALLFRNATNVRGDPDFDNDIQRLVSGINKSIGGALPISKKDFEPETIYVPAGPFLMGSVSVEGIPDYETPHYEVFLPAYRIGEYPVTNAQYEKFLGQTRHKFASLNMSWEGKRAPKGKGNYPVAGVSWYDALEYCDWLKEKTGREYTLPNEAQWEKACRGDGKTLYPWGDEFDDQRCNYGRPEFAPVDAYPAQSKYGFDFVGNVHQWTCTLWGEDRFTPDPRYPYNAWQDDDRNYLKAGDHIRRVLRGCNMKDNIKVLRCSARSNNLPKETGHSNIFYGFRVAMLLNS